MQKHFVTFYSPGTFLAETTSKPIDSWDVDRARVMVAEVVERYGAHPYGFAFSTRERGEDDLDSKVVAKSGMYYLGGTIKTLAEIEAENPGSILASNMRCNNWPRVVTGNNPWRWTQPLTEEDTVLT